MANNKTKYSPQRRHAQNVRTFASVQKRRQKHAASHGITVESLGAVRWTTAPKSKDNKVV
jgi:hypothetical protein